jgi:hypothetical protein
LVRYGVLRYQSSIMERLFPDSTPKVKFWNGQTCLRIWLKTYFQNPHKLLAFRIARWRSSWAPCRCWPCWPWQACCFSSIWKGGRRPRRCTGPWAPWWYVSPYIRRIFIPD